eukprot:6220710-Amphidinium_carterae.1
MCNRGVARGQGLAAGSRQKTWNFPTVCNSSGKRWSGWAPPIEGELYEWKKKEALPFQATQQHWRSSRTMVWLFDAPQSCYKTWKA